MLLIYLIFSSVALSSAQIDTKFFDQLTKFLEDTTKVTKIIADTFIAYGGCQRVILCKYTILKLLNLI